MEWRDEGIVIGLRRLGEASVIAEVLTRAHGRHFGLVRGGRSKRMQPLLQPGNGVDLVWRARIEDQLGTFAVEATHMRAARLIESPQALHGIALIGALIRLLPERDPHPALYDTVDLLVRHLCEPEIGPTLMVRFEIAILAELGFGLDLALCAVSGLSEDLLYVSPKSGRAVSRIAGEPWKDRLLPLPGFLVRREGGLQPAGTEVLDGFRLTEHFLLRDVYEPRGLAMPDSRRAYLATLRALA